MPPKGGKGKIAPKDANLKKKVAAKRTGKTAVYPAQLVSELNVKRGRSIATLLGIKNSSKYSFPSELVPLIKEKMLLVTDCPTCGGPCQPDSHKFPATGPAPGEEEEDDDVEEEEEVEDEEEDILSESSNHSIVSEGDGEGATASPSRSVFQALVTHQNLDSQVLGGGGAQPFVAHALEQFAPVDPPERRSTRHSEPRQSTSKKDGSEEVSSSSNEDESAIRAKVKEREDAQNKEIAEAKKKALAKKKKSIEKEKDERRKRKQDRAAARAATEKRILAEMDKKHQATLAAIRGADPDDDDVFAASPGPSPRVIPTKPAKSSRSSKQDSRKSSGSSTRPRTTSRVSFDSTTRKPRSPRSSSEHSDQDFHPAYRGSSRSHSVSGSTVDMEVIRELMDRQSRHFEKVLDRVVDSNAGRRVSISSLNGFEDSTDGASGGASSGSKKNSAGTLKMISSGKSKMARALGVNPGMKLAFTGDTDNIDVSKLQKNMQSGKHRKRHGGFVVRQHIWAHDVVSKASAHLWPKPKPGEDQEFGHWDQSFANFQEGMCQKILIDHEDTMDIIVQNKLRFQSYLICQAYILPWEDILSISEQFFEAFEYEVMEWDKWDDIEKFLDKACEQARLSNFAKNNVPAALAAPGQNPVGQPAKKFEGNIKGVTWKYMKDKKICCGFNTGSCQQQDGHTIGKGTVHHWCGGCHGASKGATKENHPAKICGKGPWDKSLF